MTIQNLHWNFLAWTVISLVSTVALADLEMPQLEDRFSPSEIQQFYSDETRRRSDGVEVPVLREFQHISFRKSEAPPDFIQEWGDFSLGGQSKGFLNLGHPLAAGDEEALIATLESFSTYSTMRDAQGRILFFEFYAVDGRGHAQPDPVDGLLDPMGDIHYAYAVSPILSFRVQFQLEARFYRDGDVIIGEMTNHAPVHVTLAGKAIESREFRLRFEFYPYQNGWFVFAANTVKLRGLSAVLINDPQIIGRYSEGTAEWLIRSLAQP